MFLLKVIDAFKKHKLNYAIAGGYAVALHGAVRGTVDIDVIVNISSSGFEKVEKALESIGLQSRLPVTAKDVYNFRNEYIENRNMIAWNFVNPSNPAEAVDIMITEDLKSIKTKTFQIKDYDVKVVSVKDLIKIKSKSKRKQDIEDVNALRRLTK